MPHHTASAALLLAITVALSAAPSARAGTPTNYTGQDWDYWSNAANWSTNPLVPINGNGGTTFDITLNNHAVYFDILGSCQIDSLSGSSSGNLHLQNGCNLTVLNAINFTHSMLWASNSTFTCSAPITVDSTTLITDGGCLNLNALTTCLCDTSVDAQSVYAKNVGTININSLATVNIKSGTFILDANTGSTINAATLNTINYLSSGAVTLTAAGTASLLYVPHLGDNPLTNVSATVSTGGTINWGNPTSFQKGVITLDTAGTINTASLTNIDGSNLYAQNGAALSLPNVSSYTANNFATPLLFYAQSAGTLTVGSLTTINFQGNSILLRADSGGTLNAPVLANLTHTGTEQFQLYALNTGSVINIPHLGDAPQLYVFATVDSGGTINWGNPTTVQKSSISINAGGNINTATLTNIDGSELSATNGALLSLPAVTHYISNNFPSTTLFSAQSSGTITLAALTSITCQNINLQLTAATGGAINAPVLNSLACAAGETVILSASGANSVINVPHLGDNPQIQVNATVTTGGTINWGNPTTVQKSFIAINTSGTINTATLTNIDGSSLSTTAGALLSLPSLTHYSSSPGASSFSAQSSGIITLAALTTITCQGNNFQLTAATGGAINAPALNSLAYAGGETVTLSATGANSAINVPHLGDNPQIQVNATVTTGGTINWGNPTTVQKSSIAINTSGTINTATLANIDGTDLSATNGALLSIPTVTNYNALPSSASFSAQSSGTITLAALTTINCQGNSLQLTAATGGAINAPALNSLAYAGGETVTLSATGANSVINVPHLGDNPQIQVNATVTTGGTINWGNPTTLQKSSITIDTAGTINTATLTNIDGTSLTAANGAALALPALTTLNFTGGTLQLTARQGASIDLHSLSALTSKGSGSSTFSVSSANSASVINLCRLLSTAPVTTSLTVDDYGQILLGAPTGPFTLNLSATFTNSKGPLNIYLGTTLLASIAPNHVNHAENYQYNIPAELAPGSTTLEFLANGKNSNIILTAFTALAPTWSAASGTGAWSNAANWSSNPNTPSSPAAIANFTGTGTLAAVNVDAPQTLGALNFSGNVPYTLAGYPITMDNSTATGGAAITSSSPVAQSIASQIIVANTNLAIASSAGGNLTLSGGLDNSAGKTITFAASNNSTLTLGPVNNAGTILLSSGSLLLNNNLTGSGNLLLNAGSLAGHVLISNALLAGSSPHTIAPSSGLSPTSTGTLTISSLTTNTNTTLALNLLSPGTNDALNITSLNGLTLKGGQIQIANAPNTASSLGYYKIIQYNGNIQGTGPSSLTPPAAANNIAYFLDTTHDPGFIDLHRGYLGDCDDSGFVDINDLATLANHWQQPGTWAQGNFLNDPTIDINDLAVLAANWQTGLTSFGNAVASLPDTSQSFQAAVSSILFAPTPTPEPTTLTLLLLAALSLLPRRHRKRGQESF